MTHFTIVHDFDTDPEIFWPVFFDETYNRALYQRIGVKERTVLWRKDEPDQISFSVRIMPARDLPGFIKKIVGGDLGYTETSTFYPSKNYGDVKIEPSLLTNRTKIAAKYSLAPLGPGRMRRTFEGDIDIAIPLAGRKIEKFIIEDVTRSYGIAHEFTSEWLRRDKPAHT